MNKFLTTSSKVKDLTLFLHKIALNKIPVTCLSNSLIIFCGLFYIFTIQLLNCQNHPVDRVSTGLPCIQFNLIKDWYSQYSVQTVDIQIVQPWCKRSLEKRKTSRLTHTHMSIHKHTLTEPLSQKYYIISKKDRFL